MIDPVRTDDRARRLEALRNAVPVTRMTDYGVPMDDARAVHAATSRDDAPDWDRACSDRAQHHAARAEDAEHSGRLDRAAHSWRAASALNQCAQLAFNSDVPRKKALYEQAHADMARHARLSDDLSACTLPTPAGELTAWVVMPPPTPPRAAVIVIGGLSGWGAAYLDMGRALAARGIAAILAEGPGQGLPRMQGGMHLTARSLAEFDRFVDHAQSLPCTRIGVWGNSFGGLLAAHLAVRNPRIAAVCVNGAPMAPAVPTFRTAREQMHAAFGTTSDEELATRLRQLGLDAGRDRTDAAMLVVQGGADPLVPLGSQEAFLALSNADERAVLTWNDGEHTIYNHARERDQQVAAWFWRQLGS